MAHSNQGHAVGISLMVIKEYITGFSLGGRFHDSADGLTLGKDQVVWSGSRPDGRRGWSVTQIVMICSTTT